MLRSLQDLVGFSVRATDGDIGEVRDFYFDDERWAVRYLVVETRAHWPGTAQVLLSPVAFGAHAWMERRFEVRLTREQVRNSPGVDSAKPVSRQFERDHFRYYGWPGYWGNDGLWGSWNYPEELMLENAGDLREDLDKGDPTLCSLLEVIGYHLRGSDGEIGHIKDVIVDDASWAIRYLVVDTSNWWVGKDVLLSPHWVEQISWADNLVKVNQTLHAIRNAPLWHSEAPINREYETCLYDYYGRPVYWREGEEEAADARSRDSLAR